MRTFSELDIERMLEKISGVTVLVVGDVMLDHYIWGEVSRISPEAPVPIVHVQRETFNAGGAANVALNLAGLGAKVRLLSCWGEDDSGRTLSGMLDQSGIDFTTCVRSRQVSTINKTRVVARTQQVCRIDYEPSPSDYEQAAKGTFDILSSALNGCDAVIVSDYAKGFVNQALLDSLADIANSKNVKIAIDPKPTRPLTIKKPWLITPNYQESLHLASLAQNTPYTKEIVRQISNAIHERIMPENLVITLGSNGMVLSDPEGEQKYFSTFAREVCDVSGAGDTVIATLVAACASGADMETAISLSNIAAGIVVGKLGTVPITSDLVKSAFSK
jgi:rfaE bifunctional protein kinase chain/domain